jgi:hypothetical protein
MPASFDAARGKDRPAENEPMNAAHPNQGFPEDNIDEELILIFLTEFQALEQALIRAGFTRTGGPSRDPHADWGRYARHIEARFRPDSSPELQGAVSYLLYEPEKLERRRERLPDSYPGEPSSPYSDLVWLSELVQEAGNRLSHGINFLKTPGFDTAYLTAVLFVVAAFSHSDPVVESFFMKHVQ